MFKNYFHLDVDQLLNSVLPRSETVPVLGLDPSTFRTASSKTFYAGWLLDSGKNSSKNRRRNVEARDWVMELTSP